MKNSNRSFRTEFEEHLKKVFADVQREISGLQEQIEQEFERHQSQLSEAFESFPLCAKSEKKADAGFRESVSEHFRLARDEGARITATAIVEAEAMEQKTVVSAAAPVASSAAVSQMRNAVNDTCSQNSQAAILKSLVSHAVETREEDFQYVADDKQPSESETATDDYAQAVESEASYQSESRDSAYSTAVCPDEESDETGFEMQTRQAAGRSQIRLFSLRTGQLHLQEATKPDSAKAASAQPFDLLITKNKKSRLIKIQNGSFYFCINEFRTV